MYYTGARAAQESGTIEEDGWRPHGVGVDGSLILVGNLAGRARGPLFCPVYRNQIGSFLFPFFFCSLPVLLLLPGGVFSRDRAFVADTPPPLEKAANIDGRVS